MKNDNENTEHSPTTTPSGHADKLPQAELLYRTLFEQSPDGVLIIDTRGKVLEFNEAAHRQLGYTREEFENIYISDIDPFQTPEEIQANIRNVLEKGKDVFEVRHRTKHGEIRHVRIITQTLNLHGNTVFHTIWHDITERKQAEETLQKALVKAREEKAKTEGILDAIGDAISIQDTDFKVIYQNQLHKDIMGSHEQEYCYKAFQKKDHVCEGCHVALSFSDGEIHKKEQTVQTKRGLGYLEITSSPLRDSSGKIIAVIDVLRDITEKKKTEDALRESEERYRDLFENASDLIQIVRPDGHFLYVNRAWKETFGYSPDEIPHLSVLDIIADDCKTHCLETFQRILSDGSVPKIETVFVAKDGRRIIIEGAANCKYMDGKPVSTRCMFRDVTVKKKMEEELLKIEKLESLGIFAGGIAHDFNNIMTAILGNISLALLHLKPGDHIYEELLSAEKASIRAKDLTQQLLTFSKGGDPVRQIVSIGNVLKESTNFSLRGSNIKSNLIIPDDLWPVEVDEGQIGQVVNNLVINAMQAMPEGGTVNVSTENAVIGRESALPLQEGKYVKITIGDNGIGISKKHLQNIFDPFFTTKQRGSGLGLAVTFSIVSKHDGYITVESEPGAGTNFHIYLPATEKQVAESISVDDRHVFGNGRVLVMDDEEMVRDVTGAMLKHLGYEVEFSVDGTEAVASYKKAQESGQPFDVVIMDLTIPGGMGGKEAMEILSKIDPKIKAIVSSGYSNNTVLAHYRQYGFCGYLEKPFTISSLGRMLASMKEDHS